MLLQYQSLHIIDGANKFVSSSRPYYLNNPEIHVEISGFMCARKKTKCDSFKMTPKQIPRLVNKTDEFVFYLSN